LTSLEGVAQTKLRIAKETRLEVLTKSGAWVPPERMLERIARGKYDARRGDVRLTVVGTVRRLGAQLFVDLGSESTERTELLMVEPPDSKHGKSSLMEGLADREGRGVEVTGLWRQKTIDQCVRILVGRWKPVEEPIKPPPAPPAL
jgi:hypothetical protein